MTVLPARAKLTDFSSTQGEVRTAIGDLRDFVFEALGSSGLTAVLNNPIIRASTSAGFGAGMTNPSTTVQINGNFAVTPNASPAPDPGNGSGFIYNKLQFASIWGTKITLAASLNHHMGSQDQTVYFRSNNYFAWYANGVHVDQGLQPGTAGQMIAQMNMDNFYYKGQEVYTKAIHGNLAGQDWANSFSQFNTFTGGLRVINSQLRVGQAGVSDISMSFDAGTTGTKIKLYNDSEAYCIGIQPNTIFMRTGGAFTIYAGGGFANAYRNGGGGVELFHVDGNAMLYKGSNVHSDHRNGHGQGINADMVDNIHGESIVTKVSGQRPGTLSLYIQNQDSPHQMFFIYDGARMRWYSNQWQTGQLFETAVNYSDTAGSSLNCSGISVYANNAHPQGNIAICSFSNSNRHGSVLNLGHALADDNIDMQMHHDNGYMRLLTTSGHPTRVAYADQAGHSGSAGVVTGGVSVNNLHKAQGAARVTVMSLDWDSTYYGFGVHQYTFGSPLISDMVNVGGGVPGRICFVVPNAPIGGSHRNWCMFYSTASANTANFNATATWDYLTASGNPELWVQANKDTGELMNVWEAEDPLDYDDYDLEPSPLSSDGGIITRVKMPTINYIMPLIQGLLKDIKAPSWFANTPKGQLGMTPEDILMFLIEDQYQKREWGFNYNPDALKGIKALPAIIHDSRQDTDNTKDWKVQLLLRQVQRVAMDSPALNMTRLVMDNFKLKDPNKPLLILK